jgi:hypothetical protein
MVMPYSNGRPLRKTTVSPACPVEGFAVRELGTSGERDRLVAVDPDDCADREPDQRKSGSAEDHVPGTARSEERDRSAASLETCSRAEVGGVLLRWSELRQEIRSGRELV